jgi:FkbM family methyltransferase
MAKHHEIAIVASAIGSTTSKTTITYFPRALGNSTLHLSEKRQEWDRIVDEISPSRIWRLNKLFALTPRRLFTWFIRPLFDPAVTLPCEGCTLSDLIRRQSPERVDLLKIDIEGAEIEALQGIEEQDWQNIQQLAIEVAPAHKDALTPLSDRLQFIGFATVAIESFHGGSVITDDPMPCMLYAVRAPR